MELTCETDYFSARRDGPVVVFSLKGNFLLSSTLLKSKEMVLDYLDCAASHPDVRVVLVQQLARKARKDEFLSFFEMVQSSRLSKSAVMRLYGAIDQFINYVLASDLIFIHANCGQILPIFANMSLACDYRIVGDNAVFQNPALELGLVPKGGGGWFLTQAMGRGRAFELLLTREEITAQKALELGIVNRCVPVENLAEEALALAHEFADLPATSLYLAKRMVNRSAEDISRYLDFENKELLRAMHIQKLLK